MWKKDYHEYFSDISHTKATTLCKKKQPSNIGKIYNFLHAIQNAENRKKYNSKWWYIIEKATYRIEENTLALIVLKMPIPCLYCQIQIIVQTKHFEN